MKQVGVVGTGLICSGGNTPAGVWARLVAGRASYSQLPDSFAPYVKTTRAHLIQCSSIPPVGDRGRLPVIALKAAVQALNVAQVGSPDALLLGSSSASYAEIERGNTDEEPSHLGRLLSSALNIPEYMQFSQACASSGMAIATGVDMIRAGEANVVLVGGADEVTKSVMAGFEAVRIHGDECKPFDVNRFAINLGEAGAFLVLAKEGIGKPLAYVEEVGISSDAYDSAAVHPTGISEAIFQAASADEGNIRYPQFVIAHGTGTKLSDRVEIEAIADICWQPVEVASFKGALGHVQGASGALSAILAVESLQRQMVFPNVGMDALDPNFETHDYLHVVERPMAMYLEYVLCLSFGTWGTNVAMLLSEAS